MSTNALNPGTEIRTDPKGDHYQLPKGEVLLRFDHDMEEIRHYDHDQKVRLWNRIRFRYLDYRVSPPHDGLDDGPDPLPETLPSEAQQSWVEHWLDESEPGPDSPKDPT